jgi:hypothetical protein
MKNNTILGIEALQEQIKDMNVPEMRRDVSNSANLYWLQRNLGIRNSLHEKFPQAVANIRWILKYSERIN